MSSSTSSWSSQSSCFDSDSDFETYEPERLKQMKPEELAAASMSFEDSHDFDATRILCALRFALLVDGDDSSKYDAWLSVQGILRRRNRFQKLNNFHFMKLVAGVKTLSPEDREVVLSAMQSKPVTYWLKELSGLDGPAMLMKLAPLPIIPEEEPVCKRVRVRVPHTPKEDEEGLDELDEWCEEPVLKRVRMLPKPSKQRAPKSFRILHIDNLEDDTEDDTEDDAEDDRKWPETPVFKRIQMQSDDGLYSDGFKIECRDAFVKGIQPGARVLILEVPKLELTKLCIDAGVHHVYICNFGAWTDIHYAVGRSGWLDRVTVFPYAVGQWLQRSVAMPLDNVFLDYCAQFPTYGEGDVTAMFKSGWLANQSRLFITFSTRGSTVFDSNADLVVQSVTKIADDHNWVATVRNHWKKRAVACTEFLVHRKPAAASSVPTAPEVGLGIVA